MQPTKVVIILHHWFELWNAPDSLVPRMKAEFPELEFVHLRSYEGAEQHLAGADVLITWSLRPEQFAHARRVRWIHSPAAAVHMLMIPEVIASDVIVTNASGVHGPVVAEHTIALVLAMAKNLPYAARLQAKHLWGQQLLWDRQPRPREVADATLGLLGVGNIGREVARRAAALGMRISAVRERVECGLDFLPQTEREIGRHVVRPPSELDTMLAESDYVVIAAPVTPDTHAIINADRLAHMRPDACLINVSRGVLVDENALIEALCTRQIAGAALDVFQTEPLPPESPLWDMENVLITPHSAAFTERLWNRHYEHISANLRRFLAGQPLEGIVDKRRGY